MPRSVLSALAVSGSADDWPDHASAAGLARLLDGGLLSTDLPETQDRHRPGWNYTTQDYLGLAVHPAVRAAALAASCHADQADDEGTLALQTRLAALVQLPATLTFASGTEAIRQTLTSILHPDDEVLIDCGAHSAMFETVLARGARLHRFPAGSVDAVERRLRRLSRLPRKGRLLIAVPAVSAHGSRIADLAELSALARNHGAILIADVSHDLGSMGQDGGGVMEFQGCLGRPDIVVGSLAKCFGANGGFAAFRDPDTRLAVLGGQRRSRPLAPANANAIVAATGIVTSPEGRRRRRHLHGVTLRLRNHLMADGARVLGQASPLVPVLLPLETALPRTALLHSAGPQVTLLQAPRVPLHAPRWRIGLTALHGLADIDDLAELIRDVSRAFNRTPIRMRVPV